jgi:hypothetical protein
MLVCRHCSDEGFVFVKHRFQNSGEPTLQIYAYIQQKQNIVGIISERLKENPSSLPAKTLTAAVYTPSPQS